LSKKVSNINASFNEAANSFAAALDAYQDKVLKASSEQRIRLIETELRGYLKDGQKKFLTNDGQLVFKNDMKTVIGSSGFFIAAAFTALYNGKSYFVKELKNDSPKETLLFEIQNAKMLFLLGLSPKVELVESNEAYYLVMENLSGINIKEVTMPGARTLSSKYRIDSNLNVDSKSVDEAAVLFAKALVSNSGYEKRLLEIAEILTAYGYTNAGDLQFMVDLKKGPSSIYIIDSEDFRRNGGPLSGFLSPKMAVRYYLKRFKSLAN